MRPPVLAAFALAVALAGGAASAGEPGVPVVVWPTLTPAGDDASPIGLHRPRESEAHLLARAQELDATLRDAVQDLGFTLDVADAGPAPGHARDTDLVERAAKGPPHAGEGPRGTWVVSARLERETGDTFLVRIVAVPPRGQELRVRVDSVKGSDLSVRALVILRDLLSPAEAARAEAREIAREGIDRSADLGIMSPLRSPGRAVLAVNSALFGAYVAYSVQRASGNDDPRVLYPLLALGTGIGIGSALLVADEWDVSTGGAWYLSAGAWWGAGAAVLVANGQHVQPLADRYAWGIGGGLAGLGLATFALTRAPIDEGSATLVHSGAGLGLALGGLTELAYRGALDAPTPYTGAGWGAALGLVGAGALGTLVRVSPSRVMLVDLGVGLGGLAGAAAGSPLVFGDTSEARTRGFVAASLTGALAGGTVAWLLTRGHDDEPPRPAKPGALEIMPTGGVVGASATPTGSTPAYGLGLSGRF